MHSSRKKLCVIVPTHWAETMGGSQYQASLLVRALVEDDRNEVFFLARCTNLDYRPDGYKLVRVVSKFSIGRYRRMCDIPAIISALRKIKPDIIYQRVGGAYTGAAAFYARWAKCRMVWHIASENDVLTYRECCKAGAKVSIIEKKILEYGIRHVDHIIAQTHRQADLLNRNYGRKPTAVIPNFHPLAEETLDKPVEKRIVWLANMKPLKQPEIFLRLAENLADIENVKFIMIGAQLTAPSWKKSFRARIEKLGNFEYMGQRTQEEVNSVLASAYLLVNTSLFEGFSNTFVQAWMRRVPVISLNVNPDDVFESGQLGIHSGCYEALENDVRRLLGQPEVVSRMGEYAQQYAIDNHSERNIGTLIEILFGQSRV